MSIAPGVVITVLQMLMVATEMRAMMTLGMVGIQENPRDGEPCGLPPMGSHRVRHD